MGRGAGGGAPAQAPAGGGKHDAGDGSGGGPREGAEQLLRAELEDLSSSFRRTCEELAGLALGERDFERRVKAYLGSRNKDLRRWLEALPLSQRRRQPTPPLQHADSAAEATQDED